MVTGTYSMRIKPLDSTDRDFQTREYSNIVTEDEVTFPEGASVRDKALVLNYFAAQSVLFFAVADNAITPEDCKEHLRNLRDSLRQMITQSVFHATIYGS